MLLGRNVIISLLYMYHHRLSPQYLTFLFFYSFLAMPGACELRCNDVDFGDFIRISIRCPCVPNPGS